MKIGFLARWLPALAREELLRENERLAAALAAQQAENARLEAYITGMQAALRWGRLVKIYNTATDTSKEENR